MVGCAGGETAATGRCGDPRSRQHGRARTWRLHPDLGVRPQPQPPRRQAQCRWQQRRLGCSRGRPRGRSVDRDRHRRVDPRAGFSVRCGRHGTDPRAGADGRRRPVRTGSGPCRPAGPLGAAISRFSSRWSAGQSRTGHGGTGRRAWPAGGRRRRAAQPTQPTGGAGPARRGHRRAVRPRGRGRDRLRAGGGPRAGDVHDAHLGGRRPRAEAVRRQRPRRSRGGASLRVGCRAARRAAQRPRCRTHRAAGAGGPDRAGPRRVRRAAVADDADHGAPARGAHHPRGPGRPARRAVHRLLDRGREPRGAARTVAAEWPLPRRRHAGRDDVDGSSREATPCCCGWQLPWRPRGSTKPDRMPP